MHYFWIIIIIAGDASIKSLFSEISFLGSTMTLRTDIFIFVGMIKNRTLMGQNRTFAKKNRTLMACNRILKSVFRTMMF